MKLNFNIYKGKNLEIFIVICLLTTFLSLALGSLLQKSPTFDETVHLTGGYTAFLKHDFRVNPESGILPQLWAAIPLFFNSNIKFPSKDSKEWQSCNEWLVADKFLFDSGNDFETMFFLSKAMMIIIALAGGLAVYSASKAIWGNPGGYISLFIYALSPTVLAHSRLVTSDLTTAVFFFISSWAFWRVMQKFTLSRLLIFAFVISVLALSKMSAVLILPVLLIIAGIRISLRKQMRITLWRFHYNIKKQGYQVISILGLLLFTGFFVFCVIWMTYGFRYSMLSDDSIREKTDKTWEIILEDETLSTKMISLARNNKILPEAYLLGFGFVLKKSTARHSFMNGKYSKTGWLSFFPYCFIMKTPLSVIL